MNFQKNTPLFIIVTILIMYQQKTLMFLFYFSFPQATNQTLLDKFKRQHEGNLYIEFPAVMEPAFIIKHYAGKVKYGVKVCNYISANNLF